MPLYTKQELFDACDILFGDDVQVSLDFLNYLQPSGIKAAFRKKAFEYHPDRANLLAREESDLNEHFKRVHEAYHRLSSVVTGEGPVDLGHTVQDAAKTAPPRSASKTRSDILYKGSIPPRPLMLGRYMYYSRFISWETLIQALVWQRRQYPTIGKLSTKLGLLSSMEVFHILSHREPGERFGQSAMRQGKLTAQEVRALLGRQQRIKPLFGRYFIQKKIYRPSQLDRLVLAQQHHNLRVQNL